MSPTGTITTGTLTLPNVVISPWNAQGQWAGRDSNGNNLGVSYPVQNIDKAYREWLSPKVRAVFDMPAGTLREEAALSLAAKGFSVDLQIVGIGDQTPTAVEFFRIQDGYEWTLPAGTPNPYAPPGDAVPGMLTYPPLNPPVGAFISSVADSSYKPFAPVAPPTPVTPQLIGAFEATTTEMGIAGPVQGVYAVEKGVVLPNGTPCPGNPAYTFLDYGTGLFGAPSYFWLGPLPEGK
jgi:hypothetical protein